MEAFGVRELLFTREKQENAHSSSGFPHDISGSELFSIHGGVWVSVSVRVWCAHMYMCLGDSGRNASKKLVISDKCIKSNRQFVQSIQNSTEKALLNAAT